MNEVILGNSILLFFAQGAHFLFVAILSLMLLRQYKVRIKLYLGALLAFWVLLHIKDLIIYDNPESITQQKINWITMIDQLTVPICGIFQLELLKPRFINFIRTTIIFFPFALLLILYSIIPCELIITATFTTSIIYTFFIIACTVVACRKLPQQSPNRRATYLTLNTLIVIVSIWIFSCIKPSPLFDILYYIMSGISWGIIYYTVENIYVLQPLQHPTDEIKEYPFANDLNHLLNEEHIYLNTDLNISYVARRIGTNRSYLSDYFNHNCNSSFIDYINNRRLCHAEELMKFDSKMSIDAISQSSGFNSQSTFRRAFIKKHGITPSQFRQTLSQKQDSDNDIQ